MQHTLLKLWKHLDLVKSSQIRLMRATNDKFLIGVTGIIFNEKHEILLVKHTYRKVPWSLPGGYLKGNEHPKQGLEREIKEETNFQVFIEKIIKTQHDEDTPRLDLCYIGTYKKGKFKKSHEVVNYGFFKRDSLPPLIDDQYKQIDLALERYTQIHKKPLLKKLLSYFK